jgi:HK97 family phage major capsid protein
MEDQKDPDEIIIGLGSNVKALGDGRIGGHLVLFGSPDQRDFYRDFFTPQTYLGPEDGNGRDVTINHRVSIKTGNPETDAVLKHFTDSIFKLAGLKTSRDELGIFGEVICDLSDQYDAMVYRLAEQGKLKWSGGAPTHMIERSADGELKMFVIAEAALTPIPAEPRMVTSRVMPLKAFVDFLTPPPIQSPAPERQGQNTQGVKNVNIIDAIKALLPGLTPEQITQLTAILGLAGVECGEPAGKDAADPTADPTADPNALPDMNAQPDPTAAPMKSISVEQLAGRLKSLGYTVSLPGQTLTAAPVAARKPAVVRPPLPSFDTGGEPVEDAGTKSMNAFYVTRFGDEDSSRKAIMTDVIGTDYRQRIMEQNQNFAKFLRYGAEALDASERKSLRVQIFPISDIQRLAREGMSISSIKTTQVEAQGELGGFAVPPNFQAEIVARLPGLTAVRGGGATVITLANGNSIEVPLYDGGDDRYVGNLRGQWGTETQAPGAQNAKLKQIAVNADIYTYKVGMSMSIVEDAANLVSLVQQDMADTMTIDEDDVFLTGDGIGKPLGILPGGVNGLSLTEVKSLGATSILAAGVKALKRGVASQYRSRGVWVGNSDTFGAIEQLSVGGGNLTYAFPDLSDTGELLSRKVYESEALADIAASSYPLIFGDMRGYTIVERLGMTIERFHDSNTGVNAVEYHLRRRIGGRPVRKWMFAAMKVTA